MRTHEQDRKSVAERLGYVVGFLVGGFVVAITVAAATLPERPSPSLYASLADRYQVEILRDEYGVPHIYGRRDKDVAFGLAFAHAEDDFATIETVLLATRGKMATRTGFEGALTDYLVGFMGVWPAVDAGYDTLSPGARALAEAYADGINYYYSQYEPKVSPYLLPVTGQDIVAGFTFKTPLFYGFDKAIAAVFEGRYGDHLALDAAGVRFAKGPGPDLGSQGVAIAPGRSGGDTLLLVNSHQPLTGPVAWYEARVKSEDGWDMVGGTFPGSPFILHGAGPDLGWASTVNKPDLVDVYRLKINPENTNQYDLDGVWTDFRSREIPITLHVLGPLRWTLTRTVKESLFGPVLETEAGAFAVNWAGRREIRMVNAYYDMNKARSLAAFEKALATAVLPSINYIVADKQGSIAHYYNAMFPDRPEGPVNWSGIIDGSLSRHHWTGYKGFNAMPKTVNPPSGAVYNANNTPFEATDGKGAPAPSDFAPSMGIQRNMTNRAVRLKRLLSRSTTIDLARLKAIKYDLAYDPESDMIQALRAFLAAGLPEGTAGHYSDAFRQLAGWSLETNQENQDAALGVLTLYPFVGARLAGQDPPPFLPGFKAAVDHLITHFGTTEIPWGQVNRLKRGSRELALQGGPDILRAVYGWPADEKGKLIANAGDSYILFARWDSAGRFSATSVHNFGSATLDKASPHFDDQMVLFADQKEKTVALNRDDVIARATKRITFGGYHESGTDDQSP